MDIGKLYDQSIAGTYDRDELGLYSGARDKAYQQIKTHIGKQRIDDVLDLAVGTGESLLKMKELFPEGNLHGIDLSGEMLKIAKTKLSFNAIHDDVLNTCKHFPLASVDLMLMYFLTTFVDGSEVVRDTSKLLRTGGYYSIVGTTYEAFPRIDELARMTLSEDFLKQANPLPMGTETIVSYLSDAGLDVVAIDTFTKTVEFSDFKDFYQFGMDSGFFTHILVQCDRAQLETFGRLENIFPLKDQYTGSIVLARKP
ncbi:MAG: methyltransferase domain-containing protein [Methylobacter sp.]